MDRLLAVAHALHRALLKWPNAYHSEKFWSRRLYEIGAEMRLDNLEIAERFEAFIAVGYWES